MTRVIDLTGLYELTRTVFLSFLIIFFSIPSFNIELIENQVS